MNMHLNWMKNIVDCDEHEMLVALNVYEHEMLVAFNVYCLDDDWSYEFV